MSQELTTDQLPVEKRIGVGFGVILENSRGEILLGKRHHDPVKAASELHGEGTWTLPGGKLQYGELLEEGARREVLEETGIEVGSVEILTTSSDIVDDAHFVTVGMATEDFEGVALVREPEEITEWGWFSLDNLPEPLFFASKKILDYFLANTETTRIPVRQVSGGLFSDLNEENYEKFYSRNTPLVFTSIPSSLFYQRADISAFVLRRNAAPLNPYMNFDYNLFNTITKQVTRIANNNLIRKSDEVWVFAENFHGLSDGVMAEIVLARLYNKTVRFFQVPQFIEVPFSFREFFPIDIYEYYGIKLKDVHWPVVYTAMSSQLFYFRTLISKFVLESSAAPINPFMVFDYFLADKVDREDILFSNSACIDHADELWVFGKISDGVSAEMRLAEQLGMPIRCFAIEKPGRITAISREEALFE